MSTGMTLMLSYACSYTVYGGLGKKFLQTYQDVSTINPTHL